VIQLIAHESPVINGDGTVSRDFTYIDNVYRYGNDLFITYFILKVFMSSQVRLQKFPIRDNSG